MKEKERKKERKKKRKERKKKKRNTDEYFHHDKAVENVDLSLDFPNDDATPTHPSPLFFPPFLSKLINIKTKNIFLPFNIYSTLNYLVSTTKTVFFLVRILMTLVSF